ncbi:MAG: SPOR domain-containing protein [Hyphomicrobiales bacterium]|nr:SPOR domain-containing protein [Hyphomicrobiales bacterium]
MGLRSVVSKRLGIVLASAALALGMLSLSSTAQARHRHHGHHYSHHVRVQHHARHYAHVRRRGGGHRSYAAVGAGYLSPTPAEIVVDANSGRTLSGFNEHLLHHPASLTKVMTLYMLFDQLEKGRMTMETEIPISAHAAAQAPSKLGLRPGSSIEVEDAIKAIVTKSANDIAVAIAEAIGGDESTFAEMMTRKAHALGMSHTHYANASGLPNPQQLTTAWDLAILGRAIQDRFPKYYHYFSTRSFAFRGQNIRSHDHLLGRVEGVDGIKTGYTVASGFNLLTNARRGGRHVVAVVLGGRSAASRDRRMAALIEDTIEAGASSRSVAAISESNQDDAPAREPARVAVAETPRVELASARAEPVELRPQPAAEAPSLHLAVPTPPADIGRARIIPVEVVTSEKPRPAYVSGAARVADVPHAKTTVRATSPVVADGSTSHRAVATGAATPSNLRWVRGAQPVATRESARGGQTKGGQTKVAKYDPKPAPESKPAPRTGWMIQIGATDDAAKANELLSRAKGKSRTIASAHPFTEKVQKGRETLWRARFAGLEANSAESACRELKRSGFSCIAMKN